MAEDRKCAWCGVDISHKRPFAKYCSVQCKEIKRADIRGWNSKLFFGPQRPEICKGCGNVFEKLDPRQEYCQKGGVCWSRQVEQRGHIKMTRVSYMRSDASRQKQRAWYRNRAAQAAISLLIMPIENTEPNQ